MSRTTLQDERSREEFCLIIKQASPSTICCVKIDSTEVYTHASGYQKFKRAIVQKGTREKTYLNLHTVVVESLVCKGPAVWSSVH